MELLIWIPIFAAGFGCGYYVRERISNKRRERYLASKRGQKIPEPRLLTFKTIGMRDIWRFLSVNSQGK
jgi:hypothetical protein